MKKICSIFEFSNPYLDLKDREQQATVILEIDYCGKNFTIKPHQSNIINAFTFEKSSHRYKMWKAVLLGINQAIDFGNNEIGVENKHETL